MTPDRTQRLACCTGPPWSMDQRGRSVCRHSRWGLLPFVRAAYRTRLARYPEETNEPAGRPRSTFGWLEESPDSTEHGGGQQPPTV